MTRNTLRLDSGPNEGNDSRIAYVRRGKKILAEISLHHRRAGHDDVDSTEDVLIHIIDHNNESLITITVTKDGIVDYWTR